MYFILLTLIIAENNSIYYAVFEYVPTTLHDLLEIGEMKNSDLYPLFMDILEGLEYIGGKNIVHMGLSKGINLIANFFS